MRRIVVAIVGITLISFFCYLFWKQKKDNSDPVAEAVLATPTLTQIWQALQGAIALHKGETQDAGKRRVFTEMFKKRFRKFNPTIAVGLRFERPDLLRLYFPARLEPYYRDRIAYTAWREIRDLFGVNCEISLWDTYIGLAPSKEGVLKPEGGDSNRVQITHDFPREHYVR